MKTVLVLLYHLAVSSVLANPYCPHFSTSGDEEEGTDRVDGDERNKLQRTLNVHIVPHTHDDVGWLKTVDQYFYGLNNTIQQAHVSLILDNVLSELQDPYTTHNRTFTYVEMKFFSKWYLNLPSAQKEALKGLIQKEQFSFANGGWCMHDEATTHFMGMIDQTTLGHQFLLNEFGVIPKVGWQIDPFGHSATQGGLLTSSFGFDALYFGRIHYVDLLNRQNAAECEGLWSSAPDSSSVFWGLTGSYGGNYGAPDGFCFDVLCGDDPLVGLEKTALVDRIKLFTNALGKQANQTKGRNIMLTMGMDFQYSNARKNFENLDLLIDATRHAIDSGEINVSHFLGADRFDNMKIFYSTPEKYTQCKYADFVNAEVDAEITKYNPAEWSTFLKTNDFFPYADCEHCYWTGYFTSRQGLKKMEKVGSSFLHAARQIESISKLNIPKEEGTQLIADTWNTSPLYELDDAMGVVQHHDGVSGTSKQHVAYDYAKRIAAGMNKASIFVTDALQKLLLKSDGGVLDNLTYCNNLLNETLCTVSQEATKKEGNNNEDIYIIVYNALAKQRHEVVSLPVDSSSRFVVEQLTVEDWVTIDNEVVANENYVQVKEAASNRLLFEAQLPPLGVSIYRVASFKDKQLSSASAIHPAVPRKLRRTSTQNDKEEDIIMTNDILSVSLDRATGVVKSISNLLEGITMKVDQQYGFYKSFFQDNPTLKDNEKCLPGYTDNEGDEHPWLKWPIADAPNSGAYIFRPTRDQKLHTIIPKQQRQLVVKDGLVKEVHSVFDEGGWVKQIARLLPGKDFLEIEYVVGPVPIDDGGKEVVSKWTTTIESDGHFYTDSNGREFQKRKRGNHSVFGPDNTTAIEPVAGNYYPVNAAIYIEDDTSSFGILVDRSQGGSSQSDGSVELMIQRRILYDDSRGVGEPMNETDAGITPNKPYGNAERMGNGVIIKGHHRLVVGKAGRGASKMRGMMDEIFSQPHVFVASTQAGTQVSFQRNDLSMLHSSSLPDNVMLVSFIALGVEGAFILRLGHQYGPKEDRILSLPVEVDLQKLFPGKRLVSVKEKTLSANQDHKDWEDRRFRWDCSTDEDSFPPRGEDSGRVVLHPMEILTFEILVLLS